MRIQLEDCSGHAFTVQLARALAARGHEVLYTYATQWNSGRGRLSRADDDPDGLTISGITAQRPYEKYSPVARTRWEISYARAWRELLRRNPRDVVIACNTQLFVAASMQRHLRKTGKPFVYWHQDISSLAIGDEAARRLPKVVVPTVARLVEKLERALVRDSAGVVAIGEPFVKQYQRWGLTTDHVRLLPNWGPLEEISPAPRDNTWSKAHGLADSGLRLLYAGTLGRKHNPHLLLDLVDRCRQAGLDASLLVVSEGAGANELATAAQGRPYVTVLPYQPVETLSETLACGDVLVALLEPEASQFSVPSKILAYLCAGRPVLALAPDSNPCRVDVLAGGGLMAHPDGEGVNSAVEWLRTLANNPQRRASIGTRARSHAEETFGLEVIADQFEQILQDAGVR
ncbi:MAG: glycosyltransferase family 4 protein [Jatrophihabitantaceae bacterium]